MRTIDYKELEELLEFSAQSFEIETEIPDNPDTKKYLKAFPIGLVPETVYLVIEYTHTTEEVLHLPEDYKDRISTYTVPELTNKIREYLSQLTEGQEPIIRVLNLKDPLFEILHIEENPEEKHTVSFPEFDVIRFDLSEFG